MCIFKTKTQKRKEAALKRAKDRKASKALQPKTPSYNWDNSNTDVNHRG